MKKRQTELLRHTNKPDISILGDAIKRLPLVSWEKNMFFAGISDHDLKEWTDHFPATFRKNHVSHPVFVLRSYPTGPQVCPCSSKGRKTMRYIEKNCKLEMKETTMDRDSFLIEQYIFTLPLDTRFRVNPIFKGKVPPCCIKSHCKQNRQNEHYQK